MGLRGRNMKKVYFGMNGQFGDIILQEPALRSFIEDNPETKIVLGCSKKYQEILPLYENYHENIIDFKIWEGYDDFPTKNDKNYIEEQKFDARFPLTGHPQLTQPDWFNYRHVTTETALMMGVKAKTSNIKLNKPIGVVRKPRTVALSLFSSQWPRGVRSISVERQEFIARYLINMGYKVYQLSGPGQPCIEGTILDKNPNYFKSCKVMLGTDFLITCDSGMSVIASAYNHPTIGLYSSAYNPAVTTTKNWQPVNPNAVYLESNLANNISMYAIVDEINKKIKEAQE